jgi:hypothetical protein
MADLDIGKLLADIQTAASDILQRDLRSIQGFSETQLRDLAAFAALVSVGVASGEISPDAQPFMVRTLKEMTQHFVEVLKGLAIITVEKLINAIINVAVKAIETASGVALKAA